MNEPSRSGQCVCVSPTDSWSAYVFSPYRLWSALMFSPVNAGSLVSLTDFRPMDKFSLPFMQRMDFPLSIIELGNVFVVFTVSSDCVLSRHFIVEPGAVVSLWIVGCGLIHVLLTMFSPYRVVSVVGCWGAVLATIEPRMTWGLSSLVQAVKCLFGYRKATVGTHTM